MDITQLSLKVLAARPHDADPTWEGWEDGDVVTVFDQHRIWRRRINTLSAEAIDNSHRNASNLLPTSHLLYKVLARKRAYLFRRVSRHLVERVDLDSNGDPVDGTERICGRPQDPATTSGFIMYVEQYVARRIAAVSRQGGQKPIFGNSVGLCEWFGGTEDQSPACVSRCWDVIEAALPVVRTSDAMRTLDIPATSIQARTQLIVTTEDLSRPVVTRLVEPVARFLFVDNRNIVNVERRRLYTTTRDEIEAMTQAEKAEFLQKRATLESKMDDKPDSLRRHLRTHVPPTGETALDGDLSHKDFGTIHGVHALRIKRLALEVRKERNRAIDYSALTSALGVSVEDIRNPQKAIHVRDRLIDAVEFSSATRRKRPLPMNASEVDIDGLDETEA